MRVGRRAGGGMWGNGGSVVAVMVVVGLDHVCL